MSEPRDTPARAGWLSHPVQTVLVAIIWLLLQESLAAAQFLIAAALGLAVPRLVHAFTAAAGAPPRKPLVALRLSCIVLWDIITANLTVARIVLTPGSNPRPAWVRVPLDVRHPSAVALLATIITMTPGTVSCIVDDERHEILVHALDCADAAALATAIKQRYESALKEIYG